MNTIVIPAFQRRDDLACQGADPTTFYIEALPKESEGRRRARVSFALGICRTCPAMTECLIWAEEVGMVGVVVGGSLHGRKRDDEAATSPESLAALSAATAARVAKARRWHDVMPCGTLAAAKRHRFNHEKMCDACRIVRNEYSNRRRTAARARRA